jgi:hypothetical protein
MPAAGQPRLGGHLRLYLIAAQVFESLRTSGNLFEIAGETRPGDPRGSARKPLDQGLHTLGPTFGKPASGPVQLGILRPGFAKLKPGELHDLADGDERVAGLARTDGAGQHLAPGCAHLVGELSLGHPGLPPELAQARMLPAPVTLVTTTLTQPVGRRALRCGHPSSSPNV